MYIQCYSYARANDCGHRLTTMGAAVNYLFSVTINTKKESMKIERISLSFFIHFVMILFMFSIDFGEIIPKVIKDYFMNGKKKAKMYIF